MGQFITVHEARGLFVRKYCDKDFIIDKTGVKTVELAGVSIDADNACLFRKTNWDYVKKELDWYKSLSLNVNDIDPPVPKIWKDVADENGLINSNYGWCIWSKDNFNQYNKCVRELKANPGSRRAVMIYTRPTMWEDYNHNDRNDFMCTNIVQCLIRNNKLIYIVNQRSCDAVFGYNNDRAWHNHVASQICTELGIDEKQIIMQFGSLHVYEAHFYAIEYFIKTGKIAKNKKDLDNLL